MHEVVADNNYSFPEWGVGGMRREEGEDVRALAG